MCICSGHLTDKLMSMDRDLRITAPKDFCGNDAVHVTNNILHKCLVPHINGLLTLGAGAICT